MRRRAALAPAILLLLAHPAAGQEPGGAKADILLEQAARWDANHDGINTCDEWRAHLRRLFARADTAGHGLADARGFEAIRKADPMFADADFAYFDTNHDGRLTLAEFLAAPSPFFVRHDPRGTCRVNTRRVNARGLIAGQTPPARPGNGLPAGQ